MACSWLYWVSAPFQTVEWHHCSPEIAYLIVSIPVLSACSWREPQTCRVTGKLHARPTVFAEL